MLFKAGGVSVHKYCQMGATLASPIFGDVPDYICFIPYPTKAMLLTFAKLDNTWGCLQYCNLDIEF